MMKKKINYLRNDSFLVTGQQPHIIIACCISCNCFPQVFFFVVEHLQYQLFAQDTRGLGHIFLPHWRLFPQSPMLWKYYHTSDAEHCSCLCNISVLPSHPVCFN